jgi:hypothetical protein
MSRARSGCRWVWSRRRCAGMGRFAAWPWPRWGRAGDREWCFLRDKPS